MNDVEVVIRMSRSLSDAEADMVLTDPLVRTIITRYAPPQGAGRRKAWRSERAPDDDHDGVSQ